MKTDIASKIFSLPLKNGLLFIQNKNISLCTVSNKGTLNLTSKRQEKTFIPNHTIPILRGIEFFIYSILLLLSTNVNFIKNQQDNYFKSFLIFLGFIAIILFVWILILGYIPSLIGFYLFPNSYSIFVKNLSIGLVKCFLFALILFLISFIPDIKAIWRFNTAGNYAINNHIKPLNFFNVIIEALLFTFFVVSLLGLTCSNYVKIVINFIILLLSIGLSFEKNLYLENKQCKFQKLFAFVYLLSYAKPHKTQTQVANGGYNEVILMQNQENRETSYSNENQQLKLAFVLAEVKEILKNNNINDFGEAEWLIANVVGCKKLDLKLINSLSKSQYETLQQVLKRRIQGEPIDKIFGFTEFYGLKFKVDNNVLTPRQETELLVENVLKTIKQSQVNILDIGTGSGAIAVSIAKFSKAKVFAVDISETALKIAKENAENNDVEVKFKQSDLFSKIKFKKFDIIVSNPPYIKSSDINTLEREVKFYDPLLALDGGNDGLYFYRKIISQSTKFLKPKGKIFFEVGIGQALKVKKLLTGQFECIKIIKDYEGVQRIVCATKKD